MDYIDVSPYTKVDVPGYSQLVEFGVLTSFAYSLADSDGEIVVATTRPETMLGDTAVAVHPDDPRYTVFRHHGRCTGDCLQEWLMQKWLLQKWLMQVQAVLMCTLSLLTAAMSCRYKALHGKFLEHPLDKRRIPIILDAELVDMAFGTGAVKITPAHDPNDFASGQRHNLATINLLTDDGCINDNGGKFAGQPRFQAGPAAPARLPAVAPCTAYTLAICHVSASAAATVCSMNTLCVFSADKSAALRRASDGDVR